MRKRIRNSTPMAEGLGTTLMATLFIILMAIAFLYDDVAEILAYFGLG